MIHSIEGFSSTDGDIKLPSDRGYEELLYVCLFLRALGALRSAT